MNNYRYVRWMFLALGLATVIGLTVMNVYSLYALHENKMQSSVERQKRQLLEYTNQVRSRFRYPVRSLWQLDMQELQASLTSPSSISKDLLLIIDEALRDSLYSDMYLSTPDCTPCEQHGDPIWHYRKESGSFVETTSYSRIVTDGLAITRTRMNALVQDYRWNTRVIFDTHNSMTVTLINSESREVIAYLLFVIDQDYLVNSYMAPKLTNTFGTGEETGIIVWLHDWTKNEVLATTAPDAVYSYQNVDFIQNFPDLLNNWNLKATFTANPDIAASKASLSRNLFVLGAAMLLLIGAFIFMFFTAQRERSLAQRQAMFLANVTHELKTPLAVISAAGENLSDGRVTDEVRLKSYGSHIYNESLRLRTMIDRLLDVASFSTNGIRIRKIPINLRSFVNDYLSRKKSYLESYDVTVHLDAEGPFPEIEADPSDLQSIMDNLIDNAVKYSPDEKYVGIRIRSTGDKVELDIQDRGVGIPKEYHKYIFEKFFRVEDSLTAQTRGHGLGLSIVQDLVIRNDGTVNVSSTPGKGSVFTILFPQNGKPAAEQTASAANPHYSNKQEPEHVS
jgi:signal transduction histidine kinase